MSTHMPQTLPPDQDRGPQLMGAFWTMVVISTIMVGLRFYARFRIKSIGWDDWTMLLAQVGASRLVIRIGISIRAGDKKKRPEADSKL